MTDTAPPPEEPTPEPTPEPEVVEPVPEPAEEPSEQWAKLEETADELRSGVEQRQEDPPGAQ